MAGRNAVDALNDLAALWSPDFDAYAAGALQPGLVRCVLCRLAPCGCPPFGTAEYLALVDRARSRRRRGHVAGGAS